MFDKNFFSPLSFLPVFGSGIRDPRSGIQDPGSEIRDPGSEIRDPGSGIRDKHPGSATLTATKRGRLVVLPFFLAANSRKSKLFKTGKIPTETILKDSSIWT
jgi:hypothetical protein